jgi:hypothetical protein
MKQLIELGAARIGAAIQSVCANVDFDVLSLPGGSLIAVLLWLYASAAGSSAGGKPMASVCHRDVATAEGRKASRPRAVDSRSPGEGRSPNSPTRISARP